MTRFERFLEALPTMWLVRLSRARRALLRCRRAARLLLLLAMGAVGILILVDAVRMAGSWSWLDLVTFAGFVVFYVGVLRLLTRVARLERDVAFLMRRTNRKSQFNVDGPALAEAFRAAVNRGLVSHGEVPPRPPRPGS